MSDATGPGGRDGFAYGLRDVRVVFRAGAATAVGEECRLLGYDRLFVVTTRGRRASVDPVLSGLGDRLAGIFDRAEPHVPRASVTAALAAMPAGTQAIVAVGGGSALGLAKALAREHERPIVAVPTTYAGSEMTDIWGVTDEAGKRTGRDRRVAPRLVIYDPVLTTTLPAGESAASGFNALAHAVEALYAPDANPVASLLAIAAIGDLRTSLPRITTQPSDLAARTRAMGAAHAAGAALGLVSMGLHHKMCHVLGGTFGLPHARTHAVVLPHVVAFNAPAAPGAVRTVAGALDATSAADGLVALRREVGLTDTLASLGLSRGDLDRAAALVVDGPYANPRPVTVVEARHILEAAYEAHEAA